MLATPCSVYYTDVECLYNHHFPNFTYLPVCLVIFLTRPCRAHVVLDRLRLDICLQLPRLDVWLVLFTILMTGEKLGTIVSGEAT